MIFYETLIFPDKNIPCLSGGRGEGVVWKNYFSISQISVELESLPAVGSRASSPCPFLHCFGKLKSFSLNKMKAGIPTHSF